MGIKLNETKYFKLYYFKSFYEHSLGNILTSKRQPTTFTCCHLVGFYDLSTLRTLQQTFI